MQLVASDEEKLEALPRLLHFKARVGHLQRSWAPGSLASRSNPQF